MTPGIFGMCLHSEGYGEVGRPHPDVYDVVMGNRSIKHYRPSQGYPEWVVAFLSHTRTGGTTTHRKAVLTDEIDANRMFSSALTKKAEFEKLYKEACRWLFQGIL